ncbi:MAG: LacI family DNA-binding transcriptional regulator [Bacteroides graminisolvens]|nr:LacI family DNA-binding transcriptional regulator [Bacteroides graminisolvens]MBP6140491.1 LacI family DNA-binding transcriptional regulator [Bacteroides sp.]MBP6980959.1 LacI family DNA-binding transcriptional regulator [Bacteroides sp.]MBP7293013.1 LacI family DNA-binding transcriptional regulator [Bacteroides sp.]MBP9553685.1 LacI family DNA-binding transcriptional regulator [Bacteroides sp.]MBP9720826.1 LacI family DNA-binding transcriptional regulator [Bacteroides sp.]
MKSQKHTSLKDIAQALGVSVPTVSRALKDSPDISRALCEKAKWMAREMNYRPNPFALSLRKNAPRIIGVVVPDIVTHFFASILNGIENMAVKNGYFVIITTSHESYEHEKRNVENLVNMRVEGIIACLSQETTDYTHFAELKDINMPLIMFDRVCLTDQFSSVVADGEHSAQMATQHLLDNGCKRVAFIGGANHLDIVKRRKHGYLEALRNNKIPIEKELVVCRKIDYEEGKIAAQTLLALPNPPDAILAMNDTLAFAAIEVIKSHGLRVPNDIALIGYTDEQHANYIEPKLSAVSHQTYEMGETACLLLIDQIRGDKAIRQVMIPTHLQIRESSIKNKLDFNK